MYVQEIDFFKGTSQIFASKIMKIAEESALDSGTFVFHEGDPAVRLYILRKGIPCIADRRNTQPDKKVRGRCGIPHKIPI